MIEKIRLDRQLGECSYIKDLKRTEKFFCLV